MFPLSKSVFSPCLACALGAVSLALPASTAQADDTTNKPVISGSVAMELQNDNAFSSDDPNGEFNALSATIETGIKVGFTKEFSINTGLVMEPVQDPSVSGDDRFFDDQGLYVEALTMDYETDSIHLSAGKMGVNFGRAWDATPGVFGTDLAEEYELAEYLGFLAAYTQDFGAAGSHTVTAQTFTADTSMFAESAFTRRSKTRTADGGPGNTGDLTSFGFALDGGEFAAVQGFSYHAAYAHLANGTAGAPGEDRYAIGADYTFDIAGTVQIQPLVEFVYIDDAGGNAGQEQTYTTIGAGFTYEGWNAALSGTFKSTDPAAGNTVDDEHLQVSAGYAWENGLGLDVAYKRTRTASVDTDTVGTLLSYGFEF